MSKSETLQEGKVAIISTNGDFAASNPMPGRAVHVTIPASVAFNLDKIQMVSKVVLGKLGCGGCHSGFDIRFITETNFRFNEKLELM